VLNGEEDFFKFQVKRTIEQKLKLPTTYVDSEESSDEFYSKIESFDLFSEPKLFYINNQSGNLKKHKYFWKYVEESKDSKYIINSEKKVPEGVLEIKCDKIKESAAREVIKFIEQILQEANLSVQRGNFPFFYALYKSDLFQIYNEIQKCKAWADSEGKRELTYPELKSILSPAANKNVFDFINYFRKRKLKPAVAALEGVGDSDILLYSYHLFRLFDHVLAYKSAKRLKLNDQEIIRGLDINIYYLRYTLQESNSLWKESELKELMMILERVNLKIKSFNFPSAKAILSLTFKYWKASPQTQPFVNVFCEKPFLESVYLDVF